MNIFTKATIYYTRAVAEKIKRNKAFSTQVLFAIRRFYCQNWEDTSAEDKDVNEDALKIQRFYPCCLSYLQRQAMDYSREYR